MENPSSRSGSYIYIHKVPQIPLAHDDLYNLPNITGRDDHIPIGRWIIELELSVLLFVSSTSSSSYDSSESTASEGSVHDVETVEPENPPGHLRSRHLRI